MNSQKKALQKIIINKTHKYDSSKPTLTLTKKKPLEEPKRIYYKKALV